jgi:hypothetical protein
MCGIVWMQSHQCHDGKKQGPWNACNYQPTDVTDSPIFVNISHHGSITSHRCQNDSCLHAMHVQFLLCLKMSKVAVVLNGMLVVDIV